ncbi:MAG TPA: SAM-dependent methyltransferase [Pyrinomonadaceae bacterium]|jgi:SAM-dependent MidA family methyltransferase|nr:SAM-dependent methyltransferase [Pyrinomonadaceae bacterium]
MSRPRSEGEDRSAADPRPLAERLRERVRLGGPLSFREWMSAALYDEREGYYRRGVERWGRAGDYRTSPEVSPLFAATFARYFAALHEELGRPDSLLLVEAGGGAGHFARVLLSTLERDRPEVFGKTLYVFDEVSERSRQHAALLLAPFADRVEFRALEDVTGASVVFSNELLDALPVHRVKMSAGVLRELFVGLDGEGNFIWAESEPSTPRLAEHFARAGRELAEGQEAEVNLDAEDWIARAARAAATGGYVVTVDYGAEATELYRAPERGQGTLRAFRRHAFVEDVLSDPGEHDLTTTVDWTQIKNAGERAGLRTLLLERQDSFLLRAGLLEQLERETALAADEAEVARLRLGAREMILPGRMASSFQVLVQKKV